MAAVSLSPSPASYPSATASAPFNMATRRMPLASNPNVANSPIRNSALTSALNKQRQSKRAYASIQREEPYVQPPPEKKRHLNDGTEKALRTPVRQVKVIRRDPSRAHKEERHSHHVATKATNAQQEDLDDRMRRWKEATTRNFPTYVFYFESCPQEQRPRLLKYITHLGAREEKFFSKDITHVITTRSVPDKSSRPHAENASASLQSQRDQHDATKTIDPSLLSRDTTVKDVRRRLFESTTRKIPANHALEDGGLRQPATTRHTDILIRAQDMDKKIWHYSKLARVFEHLFEDDPRVSNNTHKGTEESNLAHLLNKERVTGPSDRDPTVATRELVPFKGPHIYIYDIEEKHKPIMLREYAKVADKKDGDWPQFRSTSNGRCPFVEEEDPHERKRQAEKHAREKQERQERKAKTLADTAPELKPPPIPTTKAVNGKRTLAEMEDGHASRNGSARVPEMFDLGKAANPPTLDFTKPQHAFTSRARSARLFAGEPVASGMQASHITSAIRSQMISSATGVLGAKAGTSKELHGLQRKVLQKSNATSTNPTSQDLSSRRLAEMSLDTAGYQRSASLGNTSQKVKQVDEEGAREHKRTLSVPMAAPVSKPKKRDLKPGYCENCQDKFNDFDEHILSKKHRKFAENDKNWSKLDSLLSQLERMPKYADDLDDEGSDW